MIKGAHQYQCLISAGNMNLKPARFYYWKDQLLKSAPEIFENRGRKVDEDRIRTERDRETHVESQGFIIKIKNTFH